MKFFERPGPANTDAVVKIVKEAAANVDYVVVASITGASAVKVAEKVRDKKVVCVTCPQGLYWQIKDMDTDVFAEIPELKKKRDEWAEKGLEKVPEHHRRKQSQAAGVRR